MSPECVRHPAGSVWGQQPACSGGARGPGLRLLRPGVQLWPLHGRQVRYTFMYQLNA